MNVVKNIINLNFIVQLVVTLSTDWGTINISESINGQERLYPFNLSSIDWYIKQLYKQTWKNKYLEIMLKDSKDSEKVAKMLEPC